METSEVLLALQKPRLYELAAAGARIDGRKPDEYRQITIDENFIAFTAEGSCRLRMGNTDLIAGVKLTTGTPFPDTPEEGVLMTGAELPPLASSEFSFGPPSPFAIETARVIDRGIRESKMLDVKKLVIEPKESVWIVNIDIQALNYDGNLIDAGQLAAVKALLSTRQAHIDNLCPSQQAQLLGPKVRGRAPCRCPPNNTEHRKRRALRNAKTGHWVIHAKGSRGPC